MGSPDGKEARADYQGERDPLRRAEPEGPTAIIISKELDKKAERRITGQIHDRVRKEKGFSPTGQYESEDKQKYGFIDLRRMAQRRARNSDSVATSGEETAYATHAMSDQQRNHCRVQGHGQFVRAHGLQPSGCEERERREEAPVIRKSGPTERLGTHEPVEHVSSEPADNDREDKEDVCRVLTIREAFPKPAVDKSQANNEPQAVEHNIGRREYCFHYVADRRKSDVLDTGDPAELLLWSDKDHDGRDQQQERGRQPS